MVRISILAGRSQPDTVLAPSSNVRGRHYVDHIADKVQQDMHITIVFSFAKVELGGR